MAHKYEFFCKGPNEKINCDVVNVHKFYLAVRGNSTTSYDDNGVPKRMGLGDRFNIFMWLLGLICLTAVLLRRTII